MCHRKITFTLFIISIFNSGICEEASLVMWGRLLKNKNSYIPISDVTIQASIVYSDTILCKNSSKTDTNGLFIIPLTITPARPITSKDTVVIQYPGFFAMTDPMDISMGVSIYDKEKSIIPFNCYGQCFFNGDTISVAADSHEIWHLNDIFDNWWYAPDSIVSPSWVSVDDCTGSVCIHLNPSAYDSGITECTFNKKLNDTLNYTLRFFVDVGSKDQSTHSRKKELQQDHFDHVVLKQNKGNILINFYNPADGAVKMSLFSIEGCRVAVSPVKWFKNGDCTHQIATPPLAGMYFLQLSGNGCHFTVPVHLIK